MAELKYTVKVKLSDETEKMLEEAEKKEQLNASKC